MLKVYIFASILVFISFSAIEIKAESYRPGVEGYRRAAPDEFPWIGKLTVAGIPACTVWILQHGLAITAKHCFTHWSIDPNDFRWLFKIKFGTSEDPVYLHSWDIKFQLDQGFNDITFLLYDPELTKYDITLHQEVMFKPIAKDTPLMIGGFSFPKGKRIISQGCRATGFTGIFPETDKEPAYEGVFQDTTCGAWDGASGGVVFSQESDGKILLYGVVAHTFDIQEDGSNDPRYIKKDKYGQCSTTMFSPLADSKDLKRLMRRRLK